MSDDMRESDPAADADTPQIFRVAQLGTSSPTRRAFLEGTLKAAGTAALLAHMTGCEEETMDVVTDAAGNCTCHVVGTTDDEQNACTCESVCTCNSVSSCVCNTVCTCNTVGGVVDTVVSQCPSNCSCNSNRSSGGSHYWYPC